MLTPSPESVIAKPRKASAVLADGKFNSAEFRKTIESAKARGLIKSTATVEKTGLAVSILGKIQSVWVDISPEKAAGWLKNNFNNRPVNKDTVKAYARDMLQGVWAQTHQGIAFNDRDQLIDGQHRLMAVIKSGKTVRMMVTFGLPSVIKDGDMTTMDAVDRGKPRSVADQLKIQHGMKNGSIVAAICMVIARICFQERTRKLSVDQTLKIYRTFKEEVDWMIERRVKKLGLRSNGCLAAFAFAMHADRGNPDAMRKMYERLVALDEELGDSPMGHLRRFLLSDEAKLLNRGTDAGVAELTLEAIRLQIVRKTVKKVELTQEGAHYFRVLQSETVKKIAKLFELPKEET